MSSGRSPAHPELVLLRTLCYHLLVCSAVQYLAKFFSMTCLTSELLLSEQMYAHETAEY